jgi:hypothetical protein
VIGCNQIIISQVGNRSRQFQYPMKSSGGEMELLHGCFQQLLGGGFEVAGQFGADGTPELTFVGEFFVVDAGDFDVDVDAVEEGPLMCFW